MPEPTLRQMLLKSSRLDPAIIDATQAEAESQQKKFAWLLCERGALSERDLARFLMSHTGAAFLERLPAEIPPWVYRRIPPAIAREYKVVPLEVADGVIKVAMLDPTDRGTLEVIHAATGMAVEPVIALRSALERTVNTLYPDDVDIDVTVLSPHKLAENNDESGEPGLETITITNKPIAAGPSSSESSALEQRLRTIESRLDQLSGTLMELRKTIDTIRGQKGRK